MNDESRIPDTDGHADQQIIRENASKVRRKIPRWLIWVLGVCALACIGACVFFEGVVRGYFHGIPGIFTYEGLAPTPKPGDIQVNETFDGAYKWPTGQIAGSSIEERNGQLSMESTSGGFTTAAFLSMEGGSDYSIGLGGGQTDWLQLGNIDMTFEASVEKDTGGAVFGASCRYRNAQNFYGFIISASGHFVIGKTINNKDEGLLQSASTAIHTGQATNKVRIICSGNRLILDVNDIRLANVTDSDLKTGIIALIGGAEATNSPDTIVNFDNLAIRAP